MKQYLLILTGLWLFSTTAVMATENTATNRSDEVLQRTQSVTPYSLDKTLQTFTKTVHGGVQHIVVKSSGNTEQVKLIQSYLQKLASDFSKGNFSDTENIHGADMPGLAQLKLAKPDDIKFEYKALENGGQIHYTTESPEYVQALHEWFDAQMKDHGNDVIQEHSKHHSKTLAE